MKSGEDQWILIHIEIQGEDHSDFSKRMFRYFYRIYDRFDKEVYAIALMTSDKKSEHPDYFHYNFFGTKVDYTYNIYKFHDHTVEELERSDNPFASAIIAGKYANKYKQDLEKRSHFKLKLIQQVYEKFILDEEKSHIYISALFYFIDYLLQTPQEFDEEVTKIFYKGGEQLMHMEKEELSPTFRRVFKVIKERELEKAEKKGLEEGIEKGIEQGIEKEKEHFASNLIEENFENEKIAQLTGLTLERVIELRKSLKD